MATPVENPVLFHLRTGKRKKVLLWVLALVIVAAGYYLWTQSEYVAAAIFAPLTILWILNVAQRQIWVYEDRVEIQHLFTRMVARERDRLYLDRIREGKWALRMKGRWRALVLLYGENFKDPVEESLFAQHFQIGEQPDTNSAGERNA